jgi:endoglycosylceramidase
MRRRLALAVVVCVSLTLSATARAAPSVPLSHAGRWITDARGRVVILHGINKV